MKAKAHRLTRCLAGLGFLLAGCSTAGPVSTSSLPPAAISSPSPSSASSTSSPTNLVRTCESGVYGDLSRFWRRSGMRVGPLVFVGVPRPHEDRSDFAPRHGGYQSQKVLVLIEQGAVVTVVIPPSARKHVALLYDPAAFSDQPNLRLSDGESAVTFMACPKGQAPVGPPHGPTQFNGGLIVAGPRCVPVDVAVGEASPRRVVISFGAGRCTR